MNESTAPKLYRLTLGKDRPAPRLYDYREPSRYPELPFDEPADGSLVFEGRTFCLTGEFPSGRRAAAEAIVARGGKVEDHAIYRTYCVIVGELPSRGWKYGNYGNKIHEAIEQRKTSGHPMLLRESTWLKLIASPKTTEQHLDELPHQRGTLNMAAAFV